MSRPLRGALIGFGNVLSKGHVPAYLQRKDVDIVAVADICEARRHLVPHTLPTARVYTDPEILLEQEAENLDFVDIATPPAYHFEIALAALEKGLHVLCETPITSTPEEAADLLKKAKQARRVLFPVHNYKHAPVVKAVQSVIDSGQIGRVRSVTLNAFNNSHDKGVPEWKANWRRDRRFAGGGVAMDQASHAFYLALDWLNCHPTAITAKMNNLSPGQFDTEDNVSAALTFPEATASIHLTWSAGVRKVVYTVHGEKGAITVDDDDMQISRLVGSSPETGSAQFQIEKRSVASSWADPTHASWFASVFDQFLDAIRKGDWVGREAKETYLCTELLHQAYRSAEEGCREMPISSDLPV
jgi:predicted dehydrogenase